MAKPFTRDNVTANILDGSSETTMNTARIMVRLLDWRSSHEESQRATVQSISQFAAIVAHVRDAIGLPCELPDPMGNPINIAAAWTCYLDSDPAVWNALLAVIEKPMEGMKQPSDLLPVAQAEWAMQIKSAKKSVKKDKKPASPAARRPAPAAKKKKT